MKTIKACLVAALVAVGLNFVAQATVMRAELSLASLSEAARLKPIAVKLAPNSPAGFSYADCTPDHMAFIGANGEELPFEVATWNTSGESVIWVRPLTTDDTITFFYGSSVSSGAKATDVWKDEYSGVWHFDQFDPSDETTRSQVSSPNSTAEAGIDAHIADKTGTLTNQEGRFGTGVQTADASSKGAGLWMKDSGSNSPLDGGDKFTISGWFKHHDADCSWDHVFYKRSKANNGTDGSNPYSGGFAIEVANAGPAYPLTTQGDNSGWPHFDTTINARDRWVYLTFVYDGAKCTTYADGKSVLVTTTNFGAASNNDAPLAVGNNSNYEINGGVDSPWRGFVDEVRFSTGAKSADWVAAEYAAMTTELAWGEVVQAENNMVVVSSSTGTRYAAEQVSPQYGIYENLSGEVEFSSPAYLVLDEGNTRAICSGWTLYGADGEVLQSGTTHQVKVALPQVPYCRFVWNWDEYKVKLSADDYTKDGLLAMWDCRDEDHIDETGWTDTSGRYKFVFEGTKADTITYDETGVYFPGVDAAGYLSEADALNTFSYNGSKTLEIVYQQTGKSSSGTMLIQSNDTYPLGILLNNGNYIVQRPGKSRSGAQWEYYYSKDVVRTISANYTGSDDVKSGLSVDGFSGNKWSDSCGAWTHNGFTGTCLANYRNSPSDSTYHANWGFIGKIMSIRIYSRYLTAEEKAANHQVDEQRFSKLVVDSSENGFVTLNPVRNASSYSTQISAIPDIGHKFTGWTGDLSGTQNPTSLNYSLTESKTVGALFELITQPVTFETPTDVELSITVDGEAIESGAVIDFGKDVVATVTPTDYTFDPIPSGWTQIGDTATITRTYPVGYDPVVIEVPAKHAFTLSQVGEGMVTGGATGFYDHNTKLTLTAAPAEGYHFAGWTGSIESKELTLEVTVNEAKSLTATFEQNAADQQVVTFAGGANAAISVTVDGEPIASGAAVSKGKTVVATATPNSHYAYAAEVEGWTKNPETGAISQEVTVGTEDINIVIPDAQPIMFTLTVKHPEFGAISSSASGSLQEGTVVTLDRTVPTGYEFLGWTDDASGTTVPLVVTMDGDKTIGADIVRIRRKATFTAPDNTTVVATVDGAEIKSEDLVEYGKSVVVTITPVGEFEYLTVPQNWSAGEVKGTITRTFQFFDQAQTFDLPAVTAIPRFEVVIDDTCENGTISGTAGSYLRDDVVTLTVEPDEGYVFSHWTGVDNGLKIEQPLNLTGYSDGRTIIVSAVFRQKSDIDTKYVSNGLVTMWDCKTGYTPQGWTDINGAFTFVFNRNFPESAAKGVSFDGQSYGFLDAASTLAAFGKCYYGTIEYVFAPDKNPEDCNMTVFKWSSACCLWETTNFSVDRVGQKLAGWNENPKDKVTTIAVRYNGESANTAQEAYQNGVQLTKSPYNGNWGEQGNGKGQLGCFWWSGSNADTYSGKIYAIRLYSRKLTEDEIKANAQADQRRYGKQSGMLIMFF